MSLIKEEEEDGDAVKILFRDFLPPFRKGYLRVGPEKVILTDKYAKFEEAIRNLEVRDDDVWVLSYPKTGTTWTQEMVWCIANNLDFTGAQEPLPQRFPFLEISTLAHFSDNGRKSEEEDSLPLSLVDSVQFVSRLSSPRFIKTHLPWSLLPLQLRDAVSKPKIIYVTRSAPDTCVSYYHHAKLIEGYTGNFEDFCKLFLEDLVMFSPFWSHVLSAWKRRNQDNVLFLMYEDMKKDLPLVIRQTAEFLGKALTEEQVSTLAQHLSFDSMKNNKAVNYEDMVAGNGTLLGLRSKGKFMRSGVAGEGKKKINSEILRQFEAWTLKNTEGTDFPLQG